MTKPKIVGGIPEERNLIRRCHMMLASEFGDWAFPEEFARELATWIVKNVRFARLSGPEIAAMVDYRAVRTRTIASAAEIVHDFLGGQYSVEAILQAHKRYGRTAKSLREEGTFLEDDFWAQVQADAEMTEEDRNELDKVLEENRRKIEQLNRAWKQYVAAKKDIYG